MSAAVQRPCSSCKNPDHGINRSWHTTGWPNAMSRKSPEFLVVRFALFDERVPALLALLGEVEQEGRIARELLQAGLTITIRIHARLEQPQGCGAVLEHLPAPLDGFRLQL